MQSLQIITGKSLEGKTDELVTKYLIHYVGDTYIEDEVLKSRDLITPVWISIGFDENINPIEDYQNSTLKTLPEIDNDSKEFLEGSHKVYLAVSEIGMLKNIMISNLKEKDCIFFIDDIHEIGLTPDMLLDMINDYPNDEVKNSFDIVCTFRRK